MKIDKIKITDDEQKLIDFWCEWSISLVIDNTYDKHRMSEVLIKSYADNGITITEDSPICLMFHSFVGGFKTALKEMDKQLDEHIKDQGDNK